MTRVFVVDDHELVRRGMRDLVAATDGLDHVGEASTVQEAMLAIPLADPDVVILDVRLPDGNGIEVCRDVRSRRPDIRFLILTSYDDEEAVYNAILAGADGYLLKATRGDALVDAIRNLAVGRSLLDPTVTAKVLERLRSPEPSDPLSDQERRILDLIAEGLTNKQIGERLFLAEKTVKNYVSSLLTKLGLQHRTQAAIYRLKRGGGVTRPD